MYSVILMVGMTAGADVPQGLLFNRGGCTGVRSAPVLAAAQAINASRPHLLARLFGAVQANAAQARANAEARALARAAMRAAAPSYSSGCSGGVTQSVVTTTVTTSSGTPAVAVQGGGFLQRAAVHRQLRVALRRGNMTPEQAAIAKKALSDPDLYEAAVTKVHRDLGKQLQSGGPVAAFGDGHLLQLLIDNLPKIIAAIAEIIKLFGM